jgi:monothiol glutaredoxin
VTEAQKARIDEMVKSRRVVLFMKGSAMMPLCGFSQAALQALRAAGAGPRDLATFDVLKDPELRDAIKAYSSWPTIPQVYIDGRFIGGSDIVKEMAESGELAALLAAPGG